MCPWCERGVEHSIAQHVIAALVLTQVEENED